MQRDGERHRHIAASRAHPPGSGGPSPKELGEQVAHVEAAAKEVIHAAKARRAVGSAITIVVGALGLIGQHRVGLVELFELCLGIGIIRHVRMQHARLLQKRPLDSLGIGIALDAEHLVEIPLRLCHGRPQTFHPSR